MRENVHRIAIFKALSPALFSLVKFELKRYMSKVVSLTLVQEATKFLRGQYQGYVLSIMRSLNLLFAENV